MFELYLEGKQIKRNQVTGMHIMAGLLLLVMGLFTWLVPNSFKSDQLNFLNWSGLAIASLGLLVLFVTIFFNKKLIQTKNNLILRVVEISAMGLILMYSLAKQWYLPAGYSAAAMIGILLAFYWERSGYQQKKAIIDEQGVTIKQTAYNKQIVWSEIGSIILKHNILTIDCRNNKLLQYTIVAPTNINRDDFLQFCLQSVSEKKHLYREDW